MVIKPPKVEELLLNGIRVIEIGEGPALAYAGKLFADFGAEVIKVEPLAGDAWRQMPPLVRPAKNSEHEESALFAWLNTNKHSITADLSNAEDYHWVQQLVRDSDIVLDARALAEGAEVLKTAIAQVDSETSGPIEIDFSWYGETGSYANFVSNYATCRAMSGAVHGSGPIEGPPHMPHEIQTGIVGGLGAFSLALASWMDKDKGSRRFVLSLQEAVYCTIEMEAGLVQDGRHAPRLGVNRFCSTHPASILKTKDGWIGVFTNTLPQWQALCEEVGNPKAGTDPRFDSGIKRMAHADEIDAFLSNAFLDRSTQECFEALTAKKHPAVIVPTMKQLLQQEVHRERQAFVPVTLGEVTFESLVLPQRLNEVGPLLGGKAPLLGEANNYYRKAVEKTQTSLPKRTQALPLKGIRIIDLTMGWAGPFVTRMMADLGAEIIKVESVRYPDWWRGVDYTDEFYQERIYEKKSNFNILNRNKKGITLDLTNEEGKQLLKELVKQSHAVVENYSAEVLPKLKLDYEHLSEVNPNLVMLSMPAFGLNNRWSNVRAYGGTLEQASGLPIYTGHAHEQPAMTSYAYGDPIGGFNGSAALLLALYHQKKNKKGSHINMSQVEGMLPLTAPFLIEQSLTGQVPERQGNQHPVNVPNNCFPCAGDDQWIMLSVKSDKQWQSLCELMGLESWSNELGLESCLKRRQYEKEIEEKITTWTLNQETNYVLTQLQNAGIYSGIVHSIPDLLDNEHLWERGFWFEAKRSYKDFISSGPFFRMDNNPLAIKNHAPTLGEHTEEVLKNILQVSDDELMGLKEREIIGTEAKRKR